MIGRTILVAGALVALAGCSGKDDAAQQDAAGSASATAPAIAEINAQPVIASDGPAKLTPLVATAANTLGAAKATCTFLYQGRALLVASSAGDTGAPTRALAVIGGSQVGLTATNGDGPAALKAGPELSGGDYRIAVERAAGLPKTIDNASEWAADLAVTGPDGASKFAPGSWRCTA